MHEDVAAYFTEFSRRKAGVIMRMIEGVVDKGPLLEVIIRTLSRGGDGEGGRDGEEEAAAQGPGGAAPEEKATVADGGASAPAAPEPMQVSSRKRPPLWVSHTRFMEMLKGLRQQGPQLDEFVQEWIMTPAGAVQMRVNHGYSSGVGNSVILRIVIRQSADTMRQCVRSQARDPPSPPPLTAVGAAGMIYALGCRMWMSTMRRLCGWTASRSR